MEKLNQNFSSADRRREKAEKDDKLNISHWRGELHSHTLTDKSEVNMPEDVIEHRKGSNCGKIPLQALVRYHSKEMLNDYMAITEHSRDASPDKALEGITNWFNGMYANNEIWIEETFGKKKDKLSDEEWGEIHKRSEEEAKKVALYGDERLEEIYADIDKLGDEHRGEMKILKGVEASVLPDGSLDTDIANKGEVEWVNASIHPEVNSEEFEHIVSDPSKYTELIVKAIKNKSVNNIGHIGYDCPEGLVDSLDWDKISREAIKNKVSIEINLKKLMDFIYRDALDYDKYPKNDKAYINDLSDKLPELIPLLSSKKIVNNLVQYFGQGLKIAINTDEHRNDFIKTKVTEEGLEEEYSKRDFRFWRCLKVVEKYFNSVFEDAGIKRENIVNALTPDELEIFMKK